MAQQFTMELDRRFYKQARGVFEKYNFEVGILKDAVHKTALNKKRGLKTFAGGPARKVGKPSGVLISEVAEKMRKESGVNYLTRPFQKKNSDIIKFLKSFFKLCTGRGQKRQTENLLQAIVRNPILRGDYGSNSAATVSQKGFDKKFIDTAQVFRAITARVNTKRV